MCLSGYGRERLMTVALNAHAYTPTPTLRLSTLKPKPNLEIDCAPNPFTLGHTQTLTRTPQRQLSVLQPFNLNSNLYIDGTPNP